MEHLIEELSNPSTRRAAFEKLVRSYTVQLYGTIRNIVLTHEDTNDVLQNVFLKAWQSIGDFRGESKLSSWLYRIAVNESLSFLKRQKQTLSIDDDEASLVHTLTSSDDFDGDEAEARLIAAISSLPDKQRIVFNLRYYDELSYEEMSTLLDTSSSALRASYHFAAEKVREILKQNK